MIEVFSFLTIGDLAKTTRLSKLMKRVSEDDRIWKRFTNIRRVQQKVKIENYEGKFDRILKSNRRFKLC